MTLEQTGTAAATMAVSHPKPAYDVMVIGAGPAGYACAIRCGQLGLKTVCVDAWRDLSGRNSLGGSHLNAGCITTMALLESAKIYQTLTREIHDHGIRVKAVSLDLKQMIRRKDKIICRLSRTIAELFAQNHVDFIHARGRLLKAKQVEITPVDGSPPWILEAKNIVLAAGSSPMASPYAPVDNESILDVRTALTLEAVPATLAIIGSGVAGLELAGLWRRLGAEIMLLDAQENFLELTDRHISREAYRIYSEQGLEMCLGARVTSAKKTGQQVRVVYQDAEGAHELTVDKLIVAIGRRPNTENLAAPEANLLLDETGYVNVDENSRTNLPGVYAVGDLTMLGPMLAHKGIEEGVFVAEQIAGCQTPINYDNIPNVIYTDPEIAWVGQTEQALRSRGEPIKIGMFPMSANIRAQAIAKPQGLVKIIAHAETDRILGVHIIAERASDLLSEAILAMEFSASSEDLARTIHSHPSLSEALQEAALAVKNRSLHLLLRGPADGDG